jgi:uncharacterized protein (DUF58 family)
MPFVPTPRLVALAFVAALVATAAGFVEALRVPLLVLDVAIVTAALADAAAVAGRRLSVERTVGAIFSVGRENPVVLHLRNKTDRPISGVVADDPVGDATTTGIPALLELGPFRAATVRYELVPTRRGPREFGAVTVRYTGPLGLVARNERIDAKAAIDVYPDVHAARSLELLRRQGRQDARLGSLRVRGGDTEFERMRPYQVGDEPKHVDWRSTARRDELTVRQYQAESNQNVIFLLDVGRGMRGQADAGEQTGLSAIDHAMNAALLAADVALRTGDRAGLLVFDDAPRTWLPPTGGRAAGRKITRAIYALDANLHTTDYRAAMTFLRTQAKARSLVVIFTNVLEPRSASDLASAVRALLPRHLPLCVLMRDLDVESLVTARVAREEDLYVRAAAADALSFREGMIRKLRQAGVLVLDARPNDVTPELVKSYLEIKARRLL